MNKVFILFLTFLTCNQIESRLPINNKSISFIKKSANINKLRAAREQKLLNISAKKTGIEIYNVEMKYTKKFKVNTRAPKSVVGILWIQQYCIDVEIYFNKLDCFCYEEKKILAGEKVILPVTFFVSAELLDDPNTKELKSITLSYTFFDSGKINVSELR